QVVLFNADTGDMLGVLAYPEGTPSVRKFSRNGSLLLCGGGRAGKSGRVVVGSVKTGERVIEVGEELDSVLAADISPDQTQVEMGEMENGGIISNWAAHGGGTLSVRFSPDNRLVSTGRDRVTKLWDGNGAQQRAFEAFPDLGLKTTVTHDNARVVAADWTGLV